MSAIGFDPPIRDRRSRSKEDAMTNRVFWHAGKIGGGLFVLIFGFGIMTMRGGRSSFMESAATMIVLGLVITFLGAHLLVFRRRHAEAARASAERIAKLR